MDSAAETNGSVQGRYGVTRDPDGSLSVLWAWPWFWRYPLGLASLAGTAWMGLSLLETKGPWVGWLVGGIGMFVSLTVTYELFALALVAVVLWWLYLGLSGSEASALSALSFGALCFLVVGVHQLIRRAENSRQALSAANTRLTSLERRLDLIHRELRLANRRPAPDGSDEH